MKAIFVRVCGIDRGVVGLEERVHGLVSVVSPEGAPVVVILVFVF